MDSHTKENSIRLLKKLRDVYQSQLDTSVIVEIDKAIATLEKDESSTSSKEKREWSSWVLRIIGDVLRIVTNISDLIN